MSLSVPSMFYVEVKYEFYGMCYVEVKYEPYGMFQVEVQSLLYGILPRVTGSIYECYQYWSKLLCLRSSTGLTVKEQI